MSLIAGAVVGLLAGATGAVASEPARPLVEWPAPDATVPWRPFRAVAAPAAPVGVRVTAPSGAKWPGVEFEAPAGGWDLRPFERIEIAVRNPGRAPLSINARVDDAASTRSGQPLSGRVEVPAGSAAVLTVRLSATPWRLSRSLGLIGMRGAPGEGETINLSAVIRVRVFLGEGPEERVFDVTAIEARGQARVIESAKFLPFIDEFGQFIHADWPGKITTVADFLARRETEAADLAAHPEPPGRNRFGGWDGGPERSPGRYFRVEKVDGRWWWVDPDGRLFWSFGVDCVRADSSTPITDREAYFAWLPNGDPAYAPFFSRRSGAARGYYEKRTYRQFDFSRANLLRKYGEHWPQAAVDIAHRRLRSWGFNTVANWSDPDVCAARRAPYTADASFSSRPIAASEGYWGKFPDPFDASFRQGIRKAMEKQTAAGAVGDPWCLGFFVHNELGWGKETSLAVAALKSPPDQPAKQVLIELLRQTYGRIEALNEAWGVAHADWSAVETCTDAPDPKRARSDLERLDAAIAEEYFRVIAEEIRTAAPGQLYLGCRFAWANDIAVRAAARHCDVISFNKYTYDLNAFRLPAGVDKPVVIGEFHFGALDRGLFHPGLKAARDQNDRAAKFRAYVESALRHPNVVGVHWFQYRDQATTGRSDGENYQIGLVDICDTPYPEIVAAARDAAAVLYPFRARGNRL